MRLRLRWSGPRAGRERESPPPQRVGLLEMQATDLPWSISPECRNLSMQPAYRACQWGYLAPTPNARITQEEAGRGPIDRSTSFSRGGGGRGLLSSLASNKTCIEITRTIQTATSHNLQRALLSFGMRRLLSLIQTIE